MSVTLSSAAVDVGQFDTFTATPFGGSGTYTGYQWFVEWPCSDVSQTEVTYTYSPVSAGYYLIAATVTDNSGAVTAKSNAATLKVSATATPTRRLFQLQLHLLFQSISNCHTDSDPRFQSFQLG